VNAKRAGRGDQGKAPKLANLPGRAYSRIRQFTIVILQSRRILGNHWTASMKTTLPELANEAEVAKFLNTAQRTLANWRSEGKGPPFVKLGARMVRYPRPGLLRFVGIDDNASAEHVAERDASRETRRAA
jgi:hypothetical protein